MSITKIPAAGFSDAVNFRNIIINGDMSQSQRSTSVSGITGTGYNTVDRFKNIMSGLGTWTASQSTDVPTGQGFAKSFKMDCTTADASPASGDYNLVAQIFEGQMLQYLKKGTSSAESLTLSFWVKATKTGTNICELYDADNARQISKSYTINSADTWEKKTITFAGDTTGAFTNDNAESLQLHFFLGAGSDRTSGTLSTTWSSFTAANRAVGQVNHADSTSNDWYITGIQLEAGTSASEFEFLPVDVNLRRCQRYFYKLIDVPGGDGNGYFTTAYMYNSSIMYANIEFPTIMRSSPTLSQASGTDYYIFYRNGAADSFSDFELAIGRPNLVSIRNDDEMSGTGGHAGGIHSSSNSKVTFDAEL